MNRLGDRYHKEVSPKLQQQFGYRNRHQIPAITKVVINSGVGRATADSRQLEVVGSSLARISGQAPVQTKAKASIAGFKLRAGNPIGSKVTLRGPRMYDFIDRLVSVALPRVRDFRGLPTEAFDPQGNYSLGLDDQTIFPELAAEDLSAGHGLQINIVTTAKTPAEGRKLLELMGFPFRRQT